MSENMNIVEPKIFKEYVATGSIQSASIRHGEFGLFILLKIGSTERVLGQYRGGPRYFRSFDGAAALLQQNGIVSWEANTTGWIPRTTLRKSQE